ncbi:MAG: hypothetical protein K0Q87_5236, partial [Neobacillus sp.]|nr:hypothetical protein [Neobacillus sp.]
MSDLNINKNHPDEENILKENIEVWEDLVNIKSLV